MFYCNTDHNHICIECLQQHQGHDIENTEDAAKDHHKLITAQFETYKSLLLQVKKFNAEDKRTKLCELVKTTYAKIRERLDALMAQRLKDLAEADLSNPTKAEMLAYEALSRECLTQRKYLTKKDFEYLLVKLQDTSEELYNVKMRQKNAFEHVIANVNHDVASM